MRKDYCFLFVLVLLGIYSCTDISTSNKFVYNSSIPIYKEKTHLSSVIEIKQIIPLETNENSIIGNIDKIIKSKNRIYTLFNRNTLLVHADDGKFIGKIGSVGQGIGEYQLIGDFDVTENAIYLRDFQKIHQYNLDREYVRSIPFDVNLFGINVVDDKILGFVTNDESVMHIFTLNGDCINRFHPNSPAATIGTSNYYWIYEKDKYIFPFIDSNDALIYDITANDYEYVKLVDLEDILSLNKINQLMKEAGASFIRGDYGRIVWPFNSNQNQTFLITSKGEEKGILWIKDKLLKKEKAFDCNHIINDISFMNVRRFFSCFTRSDNSFLAYVMPYALKEAMLNVDKEMKETPYYSKMKELADSLSDEDNPIIIEYEFK
ncbi:MAG: 6-bladed beta-propeller [Mediterranea massiliensis]|nr:6-bladed beta-propeller [Mediterranea massiliensis]